MSLRLSLIAVLAFAFAGLCHAADSKAAPKFDMAPFKTIAEEALALVKKPDQPAAEKKIIELEDKWDAGTLPLKAADRKVWTVVDKQMDVAIEATKAAKTPAGVEKAVKEINIFIAKLADAEKVK